MRAFRAWVAPPKVLPPQELPPEPCKQNSQDFSHEIFKSRHTFGNSHYNYNTQINKTSPPPGQKNGDNHESLSTPVKTEPSSSPIRAPSNRHSLLSLFGGSKPVTTPDHTRQSTTPTRQPVPAQSQNAPTSGPDALSNPQSPLQPVATTTALEAASPDQSTPIINLSGHSGGDDQERIQFNYSDSDNEEYKPFNHPDSDNDQDVAPLKKRSRNLFIADEASDNDEASDADSDENSSMDGFIDDGEVRKDAGTDVEYSEWEWEEAESKDDNAHNSEDGDAPDSEDDDVQDNPMRRRFPRRTRAVIDESSWDDEPDAASHHNHSDSGDSLFVRQPSTPPPPISVKTEPQSGAMYMDDATEMDIDTDIEGGTGVQDNGSPTPAEKTLDEDEDTVYTIEKLAGHQVDDDQVMFTVKWADFEEMTLEPEAHLHEQAPALVYGYWRRYLGGRTQVLGEGNCMAPYRILDQRIAHVASKRNVGKRVRVEQLKKRSEYLVEWVGLPKKMSTWFPATTLLGSHLDLVQDYHASQETDNEDDSSIGDYGEGDTTTASVPAVVFQACKSKRTVKNSKTASSRARINSAKVENSVAKTKAKRSTTGKRDSQSNAKPETNCRRSTRITNLANSSVVEAIKVEGTDEDSPSEPSGDTNGDVDSGDGTHDTAKRVESRPVQTSQRLTRSRSKSQAAADESYIAATPPRQARRQSKIKTVTDESFMTAMSQAATDESSIMATSQRQTRRRSKSQAMADESSITTTPQRQTRRQFRANESFMTAMPETVPNSFRKRKAQVVEEQPEPFVAPLADSISSNKRTTQTVEESPVVTTSLAEPLLPNRNTNLPINETSPLVATPSQRRESRLSERLQETSSVREKDESSQIESRPYKRRKTLLAEEPEFLTPIEVEATSPAHNDELLVRETPTANNNEPLVRETSIARDDELLVLETPPAPMPSTTKKAPRKSFVNEDSGEEGASVVATPRGKTPVRDYLHKDALLVVATPRGKLPVEDVLHEDALTMVVTPRRKPLIEEFLDKDVLMVDTPTSNKTPLVEESLDKGKPLMMTTPRRKPPTGEFLDKDALPMAVTPRKKLDEGVLPVMATPKGKPPVEEFLDNEVPMADTPMPKETPPVEEPLGNDTPSIATTPKGMPLVEEPFVKEVSVPPMPELTAKSLSKKQSQSPFKEHVEPPSKEQDWPPSKKHVRSMRRVESPLQNHNGESPFKNRHSKPPSNNHNSESPPKTQNDEAPPKKHKDGSHSKTQNDEAPSKNPNDGPPSKHHYQPPPRKHKETIPTETSIPFTPTVSKSSKRRRRRSHHGEHATQETAAPATATPQVALPPLINTPAVAATPMTATKSAMKRMRKLGPRRPHAGVSVDSDDSQGEFPHPTPFAAIAAIAAAASAKKGLAPRSLAYGGADSSLLSLGSVGKSRRKRKRKR